MNEPVSKEKLIENIQKEAAVNLPLVKAELENDLFKFNRYVLDVEEGKGMVKMADVHKEMCEFVDKNKNKKKLILIPRGHLKSTCITEAYTIQTILKQPDIRILIANATYQLACSFLTNIKRQLKFNKKIHMIWGNLTEEVETWSENQITLGSSKKKEPTVTAMGVESNLTSQHYDLIIMDDLVNKDYVNTREQIKKTIDFYKESLNLLEPEGEIIMIGCLTADSQVLMADGTWKKIIDVKPGEKVWSVNDETGEREIKTVKAMIPQGKDVVYEVKTKRHSLKATEDHPFLTFGNCECCGAKNHKLVWKKAKDLEPGEFVITSKQFPTQYRKRIFNNEFATKDFYWFFGFLMGDGWVTESGHRSALCACYGEDEEVNQKVKSLMKKYAGNVYKTDFGYYRVDNKRALDFKEWGIDKGADGKRIPDWIFKSRPSLKRAFLRGFIAADGTKLSKGNGYRIELTNKDLVDDIYKLALTCSVRPTSVYRRKRTLQPPNSPKPVESETHSIGLVFKHWQEKENKTVCQTPFELLGLRMERITEVNKLDKQEVYDLTVKDTHNFIANGYVVHNTRWRDDDLYGWVMDEDNKVVSDFDIFKKEAYQGSLAAGEDFKALFPEKFTKTHLRKLREQQGPYIFSAQYLNNPVPEDDATFKRSWFSYFDETELKGKLLNKFITIDPAISIEKDADYTAIVTVGVDEFGVIYVLDVLRSRLTPKEINDNIFKLWSMYAPVAVGIEDVAFQKSLQYSLSEEMQKRNIYLPLQPLKPAGRNKDQRIKGLQPLYANKRILHNKNVRNTDHLEDELLRFPRGKHDDTIDALAYILDIPVYRPKRKKSRHSRKQYLYA